MAEEPELFPLSHKGQHETRMLVFERDGYTCRRCNKQLTRFAATVDYVKAPEDGGNESVENLITTCSDCNTRRQRRAS